jgi:hypothetical protein
MVVEVKKPGSASRRHRAGLEFQCRRDAQDEPEDKGHGAGQVNKKASFSNAVIQVEHGDEQQAEKHAAQEKIDSRDVQKDKAEQQHTMAWKRIIAAVFKNGQQPGPPSQRRVPVRAEPTVLRAFG